MNIHINTLTNTQHTHLTAGVWLPCRLNTLSSLSWVVGAFPLDKEKFKAVLSASGPLSTAGLPSERSLHRPLPLWESPLPGRWGGLLGEALRFSKVSWLSRPRVLLGGEVVLEAGPSCRTWGGQAGVWADSSGACRLPSSWGWVVLLKAGDCLSERLRRESWKEQGQKQRWGSPWREVRKYPKSSIYPWSSLPQECLSHPQLLLLKSYPPFEETRRGYHFCNAFTAPHPRKSQEHASVPPPIPLTESSRVRPVF